MPARAKALPSRQPRRPRGGRDGGQWSAKPVADSPGAEGFTLGGNGPGVRHPPVSATIRGKRVKFAQTPDGAWEHNLEGCDILWMMPGTEPDYWASGECLKDADGVSVWAASIVRDMLNAGECDPRDPQSVQTALRSAYTSNYRDNGRHVLTGAMARSRAWMFLSEQNPRIHNLKLGGFLASNVSRRFAHIKANHQAHANAMAVYKAIQPGMTTNASYALQVMKTNAIYARPGSENSPGSDVYLGEDGDLVHKVLFAPVCERWDNGQGPPPEPFRGVDVLHNLAEGVVQPAIDCPDEWQKSTIFHEASWRHAAIRAAAHDPDVKEVFMEPPPKGTPLLRWIKFLSIQVSHKPDPTTDKCRWAGDEAAWAQASDLMIDLTLQRLDKGHHVSSWAMMNWDGEAFQNAVKKTGHAHIRHRGRPPFDLRGPTLRGP